jgi:hypothetical protein
MLSLSSGERLGGSCCRALVAVEIRFQSILISEQALRGDYTDIRSQGLVSTPPSGETLIAEATSSFGGTGFIYSGEAMETTI